MDFPDFFLGKVSELRRALYFSSLLEKSNDGKITFDIYGYYKLNCLLPACVSQPEMLS